MENDLTEDALVASCPGDVGLVSWVHHKMDQRIKELEGQLEVAKEQLAAYNLMPSLIARQQEVD
jgi:hypothetical protein